MLALLTRTPIIRLSTDTKVLGVEKGAFVYYADTGESFYFDGSNMIHLKSPISLDMAAIDALTTEIRLLRVGMIAAGTCKEVK